MTDAEILALDHRDLNLAIAIHIMGWKRVGEGYHAHPAHKTRTVIEDGKHRTIYLCGCQHPETKLPDFAGDIKAAKSATDAISLSTPSLLVRIDCIRWCGDVRYSVEIVGWKWPKPGDIHVRVEAATEEEARARAALMAYWRMAHRGASVP